MRQIKIFALILFVIFGIFFLGFDTAVKSAKGKTVTGSLSAPTGVNASDGDYANKIGIYWDTVRYATVYRVFRNTVNDPMSAIDVGTSQANYFFDPTAAAGQQYFYWVRAENSGTVSLLSPGDQGLRFVAGQVPFGFSPLEPPVAPAGNPVTAAKASLGKALFWDEQMSSTKTVSCGTCHRPARGGSDPRTVIGQQNSLNPGPDGVAGTLDDIFGSPGVPKNNADGTYSEAPFFGFRLQVTGRKSPTYLNAAYANGGLFWDGRADDTFRDPITNNIILPEGASLESQVLGPPLSDVEMSHGGRNWTQIAQRIAATRPLVLASNIPASLENWIGGRAYPELFEEAFGTPEVTPVRIAMAIATHERMLFSDRTPFDRWAAGDPNALMPGEAQGAQFFRGTTCMQCHDGPLFSDHLFHNIAVRPAADDLGRAIVTNNPDHNAQFKTPVLRNVDLHAPYFHNGRFATLDDVVNFYNRGGDFPDQPNVDRALIRPMGMTQMERQQLAAFMRRPLTDPRVANELPPFDRPQLYTESNRVPVISGTGRPGTGGVTPNAVAIEPPLVGNESFAVGLTGGVASANAVVVISSVDPGVGASIPAAGSFARQAVTLTPTGYGSVRLAIPNNPALIGQTFHGRWYVPDASAANGFSVSRLFSFTVFGEAAGVPQPVFPDFDGDRKADFSIYRTAVGQWWYLRSGDGGNRAYQFGNASDKIVPGDYTGDGKTDIAIWREGTWFVLRSEDASFYSYPFGSNGDIPLAGDFDGDGKVDSTIFRPSTATWYIRRSSDGNAVIRGFGTSTDIPQVADYDGDGTADLAIYRPGSGQWWIERSTAGVIVFTFGTATDKPVPADYTGDGKADVAIWRPSNGEWFVLRSEDQSYYSTTFGISTDIPAPADYDGDGKADITVFRASDGVWYSNRSTAGIIILPFGAAGDKPVASAWIQ